MSGLSITTKNIFTEPRFHNEDAAPAWFEAARGRTVPCVRIAAP
jgi:hypothetical protein